MVFIDRKRLIKISAVALGVMLLFADRAFAAKPRVVIASVTGNAPPAQEVQKILKEHLSNIDIDVEITEISYMPANESKWLDHARRAAQEQAGTIMLIGYSCDEQQCSLFAADPSSKGVVMVPVMVPTHGDFSTAFALAATAREALLGPLVPELERLSKQGQNPKSPLPSSESAWLKPPLEDAGKQEIAYKRSTVWFEGGYQGDHPHPDGKPINGFWLGTAIQPSKFMALSLSIGWLGIWERTVDDVNASLQRVTLSLSLRIIFPLGPAHVSIAPLIRFDPVFSKIENKYLDTTTDDTRLEIQMGGITTWHLPLTRRLEAIVGAGLLISALSRNYEADPISVDPQIIVPASKLHFVWTAGIAWSL